jgi:hypothetical protein
LPPRSSRAAGLGLALCGFLLIAASTLYPLPHQAIASAATPLLCLVCGEEGGQDVILNLCLFVPFAVGLRLWGWPWIRVALASGLLSFTVESLQFFVPGRDPSLSDLLTNTTGGALAAALTPVLRRSIDATSPDTRLLFLGVFFWLTIQGLSAWLLSPWTPDGEMWSGWARVPGRIPFLGRVQSVRLDGTPMPNNAPVPHSAELRGRLNQGSVDLELEGTSGAPKDRRRWVYGIKIEEQSVLTLDQRTRDLYFAVPARSLQFRLLSPTLRMPEGFPAEPDRPFRISAGEHDRRLRVSSRYGPVLRSFELSLSPSQGWSLLDPFRFALGPEAQLVTALWLAALFMPLGFWAGRTGRFGMGSITLSAALVLGLKVIPALSGYPPVQWSEWLAGVLGGSAGWSLHRLASYLQTGCDSPSSSEFSSS